MGTDIGRELCRCGHRRTAHMKLNNKRRRQSCMSPQYCECPSFKKGPFDPKRRERTP